MSKIEDSFYGAIIGDALGVPHEFKARGSFNVNGMEGYGTYKQPIGTWSDDSSLMLCLAENMVEDGSYDNLMKKFVDYRNGYMTPFDEMFDIGMTTMQSIDRYFYARRKPTECGLQQEGSNGNGSIMRILPLAFTDLEGIELFDKVKDISSLTHKHTRSIVGCYLYVYIAKKLYENVELKDILDSNFTDFFNQEQKEELNNYNLNYESILNTSKEDIKSGGYVVDTFNASLWSVVHSNSLEESLETAVNLGEDTDTTACVTGGIGGLVFGMSAKTNEWKEELQNQELIESVVKPFKDKYER